MRDQITVLPASTLPASTTEKSTGSAFADPLESRAWEGLHWILPIVTLLGRMRRNGTERRETASIRHRCEPGYTRSPLLIR